ncbi:MAG TPA: hypothetical protein PKA27_01785 [Fimbriimonadaceae bacterium]|nr:hypothetical protein [Fimbriimonadaceae bacterium]
MVLNATGHLGDFPYEGAHVGRRDIIWCLRDLAQFEEYFELSEEVVYALAREEAPSAYADVATSYWRSWFYSYFDFTTYPFEKRLDLLERRAREGDDIDRELVIRAISNPFPHVGDIVPASRVGGRVAPPQLQFIDRRQMGLAAIRVPQIVAILLASQSTHIREKVVKVVLESRFSWLEHGATDQYLQMVSNDGFPSEGRKRLVADTRHYVDLVSDRTAEPDERVKWMLKQHERLLMQIDEPDPLITVMEVAEHGMWRADQPGTAAHSKVTALVQQCIENPELLAKAVDILGSPEKTGGGSFGRILGAALNDVQVTAVADKVKDVGFSQFTYSVLSAALAANPSREGWLLSLASDWEVKQPLVAISIYQLFGDEAYYREAARMLSTTSVPVNLFRGFYLRSVENIPESVWAFVSAVAERAANDENEARDVLFTVVGEFARNQVVDERAYALGMAALEGVESDHSRNVMADWAEIAIWLHNRFPVEVIRLAASREQSEFSEATNALSELAKTQPEAVLDSLVPKLLTPYESPFLLNGSLLHVIQNIEVEVFGGWLQRQKAEVLSVIAGHIPKPYLHEGKAEVPPLTRTFWEICVAGVGESYQRAQSNFGAHTFNTGVFWGHGVDIFEERIQIGKQLLHDPNPAIREWAEQFRQQSEHMLADANRSQRLDDARGATGDW